MRWTDLAAGTLTVGRAQTKASARRTRAIAVPAVTGRELRAWQLESGARGAEPIIGDMSPNAVKLWNVRRLRPAVTTVTDGRVADATAYTLRHSHASACHYAGFTLAEVARRLVHAQQTHVLHYSHVIDAVSGQRYDGLDALIEAARSDLVFRQCSASGVRR